MLGIVEARQRSRTKQTTMLSYSVSRVNGRIRYKYRYIYIRNGYGSLLLIYWKAFMQISCLDPRLYTELWFRFSFLPSLSLSIWITILSAIKSGMRKRKLSKNSFDPKIFLMQVCAVKIYTCVYEIILFNITSRNQISKLRYKKD